MDAQQTDTQVWDDESRDKFLEENGDVLMKGIGILLQELANRANYSTLPLRTQNRRRLPDDLLLYRIPADSFPTAIMAGGKIYRKFWLSKLEVKPYTSSTTLVVTELVMQAPDMAMCFVDVTFGTGWSQPLKIASELRSHARL